MDVELPQWWDDHFPPLAIYYGGHDFLVNAEPLLDRLATKEKHIKVIRAEQIALSEHCDFYWAADAVEWCFSSILGTRAVLFGCGHSLTLLRRGHRGDPTQSRLMTTTLPPSGLPQTNLKGPPYFKHSCNSLFLTVRLALTRTLL
jgi:hypothetical protein